MKNNFKFVILSMIFLFGIIIILLLIAIYSYINSAPKFDIDNLKLDFTSYIYISSSEQQELTKLHEEKNRVWVGINDIPDNMKNAIIAIEDQRFWQHKGVDFKRTSSAIFNYFINRNNNFGGSTITQQLIKNITANNNVSVKRKVQEIWQSLELERKIGKQRILELYLNIAYFGEGSYGVQASSYTYFGKPVNELSIAEIASIVGITQMPERYNPFINPKENKIKQETVLKKMLEMKFITLEEYKNAVSEKLNFVNTSKEQTLYSYKYSYFIEQVLNDVLEDLQKEKAISRALATKMLYCGGLKIYATINTSVQDAMETIYLDDANFPNENLDNKPNSAMVIIDQYSGEVRGIIGGQGKKTASRTLNRATQSIRQPGSIIKPLSVYAPAIDFGIVTQDSVFEDSPYTIDGWSPKNYYEGFYGNVTVNKAVEFSMNIVAVKVLEQVGIERSFNFLKNNFGITTLVEKENRNGSVFTDKLYNSLALGGLTDGVKVIEMAAAYSAFANRGVYIKPHTYTKVVDHNGNILIDKAGKVDTYIAIREKTAYEITKMLVSATENGTGAPARFSKVMPIAGKTGTTSEEKDRWFAGYTPYYTGVVWFGYDSPKSMREMLKGKLNPSAVIFKKVMGIIHKELPQKDFYKNPLEASKSTITYPDNRIYEGEIKNGKANGKGLLIYPDGNRYFGNFVDDLRQGKGIIYYAGGNIYEGEFNNDEINGKGNLIWVNGDKYSGEWLNGKYNGQGTFNWINGDSYSGNWKSDKFDGYGIFKWGSGNKYDGEWKNGSFNGLGTFYWANGDKYTGEWKNGEKALK
jgi:penicillin-binding protein 1A